MARGEQRGNREAKEPKKDKPKEAIPTSPFAHQGKGGPLRSHPVASDSVLAHCPVNCPCSVHCLDRIMSKRMCCVGRTH